MEIIASDTDPTLAQMLDTYEYPAILVTADYRILASNDLYRERFGRIEADAGAAYCYRVSHDYDRPCDQAGENCPLAAANASGEPQRVLHIHQTPRGEEHVDVELLPIKDAAGSLRFFIELLKPVPLAGARAGAQPMVGTSAAFNAMLGLIARAGPSEAAVLLQGESGAGKELAARALHEASTRASQPLVTLECAGLNEALFESELFGHVRGAFTGANYARQGLAEAASGGTLFLDEVGDIPLPLQVKLLRLIETGTFRPVGSSEVRHTDFRLVCATHRDLGRMVEEGAFRQDLYYRINVFPIRVPALAERLQDIPLLARALLREHGEDRDWHLTQRAVQRLQSHPWPGNVRELRNVLSRAVILSNTNIIDLEVVEQCLLAGAVQPRAGALETDLKAVQRRHLRALMQQHGGDRDKVAALAGISVRSLYRKLQDASPEADGAGGDGVVPAPGAPEG